jgi:hypothetical protein
MWESQARDTAVRHEINFRALSPSQTPSTVGCALFAIGFGDWYLSPVVHA